MLNSHHRSYLVGGGEGEGEGGLLFTPEGGKKEKEEVEGRVQTWN